MRAKIRCIILAVILILISISGAYAQSQLSIKGIVLDSASKKPVPYATITLKAFAGNILKSTYTKNDGAFMINKISPGRYTVVCFAMGYRNQNINLAVNDSTASIDLKNILLAVQSKNLKEVTVKGQRPIVTQEIDRLIYDVQADPEGKNQSMLDMLYKVPLLSVDGEDNIKLKGSGDFKIFINGRPSNMMTQNPAMALRMMRATNVLRVEVITTPSAKYDAEGTAGIINIVTKNLTAGYNVILEAFDNTRIYQGVGSAFMAKDGKLGFSGYIGQYGKNLGRNLFSNTLTPYNWPQPNIEQHGDSQISGPYTPGNIDMSYEIDSLNLLTGSFAFKIDHARQNGDQSSNVFDINHQLIKSFDITNLNTTERSSLDFGLNYQRGFKNNKERLLTISYAYSKAKSDYDGDNITSSGFNYNINQLSQLNKNGFDEHSAQLDYVSPVKKLTLETGIKLITRDNYSDISTEKYTSGGNTLSENLFDYRQNVYSAYNAYQLKLKTWGFKAGLRLEMTDNNVAQTDKDYLNLIPSVAILHKLDNANSLNFGYTQRIQRPAILQLNPFENQNNPLFIVSGNPDLVPVVSNNFDFNYTSIKKTTLIASLNYSTADNTIQNIITQGTDGITRSTFANIGKYDNLGANLNINYPVTKKLNVILNGRTQYLWLSSMINNQGYSNEGLTGAINSNVVYKFKNDWIYTLRFSAYTNQINLQGQTHGYYGLYMRINKEFFDKKLGVIVSTNSPLQRFKTITTDYRTPTGMQTYIARNDIRALYVNIYYTFGQLKEKLKKNKRGINNDDIDKGKIDAN